MKEEFKMKLEDLKKGFWGYKKESVYRYISAMEEEFSGRLLEKDAQMAQNTEQLQKKIKDLEEEIQRLRQENADKLKGHLMISDTLLDAQEYASFMKKESQKQEQEAQRKIKEKAGEQMKELEKYSRKLSQLRDLFQDMLKSMDINAKQMEESAENLRSELSVVNMSLFQRKDKSEKIKEHSGES